MCHTAVQNSNYIKSIGSIFFSFFIQVIYGRLKNSLLFCFGYRLQRMSPFRIATGT